MSELSRFQRLQDRVGEWADQTFSDTDKPDNCLKHLSREIEKELIPEPYNLEEYADGLMLLTEAFRRAGFTTEQVLEAAEEKLEVNKTREWKEPDSEGIREHVK